jgi:demethylmenaquinone methyltransferase/2-methoxy-6-polyprenyl-1,4-benzoquinol methylase
MPEGNAAPAADVREMFDRISPVYDLMNQLISGFQEPRWRRRAVREARLSRGRSAVDVACGTGKVTRALAKRVGSTGHVTGIDFSPGMIGRAQRTRSDAQNVSFVVGDALALPVDDASVDAATIAFGMRNLTDYGRGFRELTRVVRPGGRVVCLEISRPSSRLGRLIQQWFDRIVPLIGRLMGQGDAYAYLIRSTRGYPDPERIAAIMRESGLEDVRWVPLSGGIVTLHSGTRPGSLPTPTGGAAAVR